MDGTSVQRLRDICAYVAERDGDAAARRIALRICDSLDSLVQFPRKGRPGRRAGTRELLFPALRWLAVYRIEEEHIEVNRLLHGAQRFP